ncbi:L-ascorbate metabolism protein UlaG (beta-lactamase superfamily) [Algoriphagus boseongensis]|uniref:L-ascorbate metabolism protein UlaG (Beta-lactamase superfamily) n=1 Tax=Algoriphagus boseongensis TaxID=1442587 RepID=A0A4R6T6I9_9BACT|nr:MBL fold metallo-hydrolase [Algoriphagus boseongensis]TDQ16241.1 L-ascorbate metabolism protein UlaG (beta-lactamase superfamily) [Algoriphagus boseongensis]
MKKLIYLLLLIPSLSFAQDRIPAKGNDVVITPIFHGTLVVDYGDLTVYVDPYGGAARFASQKPADLVLITDIHGDHHNQETLDGLDLSQTTIIAPKEVAEKLPAGKYKAIEILGNGQTTTFMGAKIKAIPMYNLPETEDSRHPKGRGNGYVVEMGGKSFYFSGDTEDIPEMRALKNIDVAFVCMNLPFTMTEEQAASAVSEFKPGIVYPYHFRGSQGFSDVEKFKTLVNQSAPKVDVRLRNWYAEN